VACLGLFGLASFTTVQRTKEIGVRKVLGASVISIVGLLTKDFVKLILIANLFALPLAYYIMTHWLSGYPFRITIGWWMFVFPLLIVILIAILTVSFQTIRAALANPVKSLRYE
jgi:putative ABC transport system permease protein